MNYKEMATKLLKKKVAGWIRPKEETKEIPKSVLDISLRDIGQSIKHIFKK